MERRTLKLLSAFEGAGKGVVIGVFELGAEGKSAGETGYPDAERQKELIQIKGGLLSFEVGISGQDDLVHGPILQSVGKFSYPDVVGTDTFDR